MVLDQLFRFRAGRARRWAARGSGNPVWTVILVVEAIFLSSPVSCRCLGCRAGSGGGRTPRSSCCAISSLWPSAEAPRLLASDVAGPGVAGAARGDGAGGAPGGDAIDRHSRHDLALAARHRAPPMGAPVARGPVRAPGDASQGVGGAAAGAGERVLGLVRRETLRCISVQAAPGRRPRGGQGCRRDHAPDEPRRDLAGGAVVIARRVKPSRRAQEEHDRSRNGNGHEARKPLQAQTVTSDEQPDSLGQRR